MHLDENKHGLNNTSDTVNKISSKLERNRESLSNETAHVRDQLAAKVDQIDKYYLEEINKIESIIRSDKNDVKGEITKSYESLNTHLNSELDRQKIFVTSVISAA